MKTSKISKRKKRISTSPRDAKNYHQLCGLQSDSADTRDYWIFVTQRTVSLTQQRTGGEAKVRLWDIPKTQFNQLIDWYNTIQSAKK